MTTDRLCEKKESKGRAGHPSDREELRSFWQARFYDFNVYSRGKVKEKVNYMHANPVIRKLVKHPKDVISKCLCHPPVISKSLCHPPQSMLASYYGKISGDFASGCYMCGRPTRWVSSANRESSRRIRYSGTAFRRIKLPERIL